MFGAQYDGREGRLSIHQQESLIFGSTEKPSRVRIRVTQPDNPDRLSVLKSTDDPPFGFPKFGREVYALFPLTQEGRDDRTQDRGIASVLEAGFEFRVKISWPTRVGQAASIEDEIRETLRTWIHYGGVGGRTRRGCGALHLVSVEESDETWWRSRPLLPNAKVLSNGQPTDDAMKAWQMSLGIYQDFRQTDPLLRGRKHRKEIKGGFPEVPGRTHWPEPDSIRQITNCKLKKTGGPVNVPDDENTHDHTVPVVPEDAIGTFPRAALGMPIIFHFADGPGKNQSGNANLDPPDMQLMPDLPTNGRETGSDKPKESDRMASPVITRPIWDHEHECWNAGLIILHRPEIEHLRVRLVPSAGDEKTKKSNTTPIAHDKIIGPLPATAEPMRVLLNASKRSCKQEEGEGHHCALDALVDYACIRGFSITQ
jgi:CRISPR-associated protein Cmr1